MGILSADAAAAIYHAHREIEAGEKLLKDMAEQIERNRFDREPGDPLLEDGFGRRRHLELGIPSGSNGHRILRLNPSLAKYIILAHIAEKRKELEQACIAARVELDGTAGVTTEEPTEQQPAA